MTTLNSTNCFNSNVDDATVEAGTNSIGILITLDYPALAGSWDDELLPSGD